MSRLRQGGLRGQGLQSPATGHMRFAHPAELGYLNAIPPRCALVSPPRAALCLVGQIASPLQALWIFAQIQQWADGLRQLCPALIPCQVISDFKSMLLQQRRDCWFVPSMFQKRIIPVSFHGVDSPVAVKSPVTALQLVEAEKALAGPGIKVSLQEQARQLAPDTLLQADGQYILLHTSKCQVRTPLRLPQNVPTSDSALWWGLHAALARSALSMQTRVLPATALLQLQQLASLDRPLPMIPALGEAEALLCPFLSGGHWALLKIGVRDQRLEATCFDGIPGRSIQDAEVISRLLSQCLGIAFGSVAEARFGLQQEPAECGAIVLAHASFLLQVEESPFADHMDPSLRPSWPNIHGRL